MTEKKITKKEVTVKTSTYLTEKAKKVLNKLAKKEGKKLYEVVNEAILFYASTKK